MENIGIEKPKYLNFYGVRRLPFEVVSNPYLFFESSSHKEALALLFYGVKEKKGLILITGEVGTGKTTLGKVFLKRLPSSVKTSFIPNPYFSSHQLLKLIASDFGIIFDRSDKLQLYSKINDFLIQTALSGGNAVVIIDEAQHLNTSQLEQIRLLSNLETSFHKLLQIVLIGQPEILTKLKQHNLRQLSQRIFIRYNLCSLKEDEVGEYINFRLENGGIKNVEFLPESLKEIYAYSRGIPRLINMLCERIMLLGFLKETKRFSAELVRECIKEIGE